MHCDILGHTLDYVIMFKFAVNANKTRHFLG